MSILKERCPNCGGTIIVPEKKNIGECDSCGMTYSLSELHNIKETKKSGQLEIKKKSIHSYEEEGYESVFELSKVDTDSFEEICEKCELALVTEQWKVVYDFSNELLRREPRFAKAYLYRLLADYKIFQKEDLEYIEQPLEDNDNYRLLIRFADIYLKTEIENYNESAKLKCKEINLEKQYQSLCTRLSIANTALDYQVLANGFYSLGDYKNSKELFEEYLKKFEATQRKAKVKVRRKKICIGLIISCIIFTLITSIGLHTASYRVELFSICVTNKINDTYNDKTVHCLFDFEITNNSSHHASYLQGVMTVKDKEGNVLSSGNAWFRGNISSKDKSYFNLSWNMERTDSSVEIWNTNFSELVITYRIAEVHFDDGTVKKYTSEDVIVN